MLWMTSAPRVASIDPEDAFKDMRGPFSWIALGELQVKIKVYWRSKLYQSYIRVKGIKFRYDGNSYPNLSEGWSRLFSAITSSLKTIISSGPTSVGLDLGDGDWAAARPPQPVGFDIVRHNVFRYRGIKGLGGTCTERAGGEEPI